MAGHPDRPVQGVSDGRHAADRGSDVAVLQLGPNTSFPVVAADMVVMGLGFGLITQIMVVAVQNAVEQRKIGTATASTNFFRSLGGSLGLALFGAIFSARLHTGLTGRPRPA